MYKRQEQTPEELAAWKRYVVLADKKKKLASNLKKEKEKLTKDIEAKYPMLTELEVREMVFEKKWMSEMKNRLDALMLSSIQGVIQELHQLSDRYATTLSELEQACLLYTSRCV